MIEIKPLYQHIIDAIQKMISKNLHKNDKLPSERQLMAQYHVSRNTIRMALDYLERRGQIYRLHGKGTFVSGIVSDQTDLGSMYSFTQEMKRLHHRPVTINLALQRVEPSQNVARELNLSIGQDVYELRRLRIADQDPMMIETSYLPEHVFPSLSLTKMKGLSLYGLMQQTYRQTVTMAFEDIKADLLMDEEAVWLDNPSGAPCLKIFRRSIDDKNVPIEFTKSVARADKFVYRTKHYSEDFFGPHN